MDRSAHGKVTVEKAMAHFGYSGDGLGSVEAGTMTSIWPVDGNHIFPPAIQRIDSLRELLEQFRDPKKKLRVMFDLDPEFPVALVQISGLFPPEWVEWLDRI